MEKVKITWIGHASFMLETANMRVYIDPYKLTPEFKEKPADGVLITHEHGDHFDAESLKIIVNPKTELICPATCAGPMTQFGAKGLKPWDKSTLCGFDVEAVPSYNPNKKFHPKANDWLGYIIDIEGHSIFHTGDADFIPEYDQLKGNVDVALLPVGDNYTMNFADGLKTVAAIEPKIVIPMHLWKKDPQEFKHLCQQAHPKTRVEDLSHKSLDL